MRKGHVMVQNRPWAIALIVVYLAVINGLVGSAVSVSALFLSDRQPFWVTIMFLISLVFCLLSFVASYGLSVMADWGRKLAATICAVSIPLNLAAMKIPGQTMTFADAVLVGFSIALDVLIIWYLFRNDVKPLFLKNP